MKVKCSSKDTKKKLCMRLLSPLFKYRMGLLDNIPQDVILKHIIKDHEFATKISGVNRESKNNFYKHLLINGNLLSTSATIISKKFLKKNKLKFNESKNFVSVEDYDLWMLFAKKGAKFFL